MIAHDIVFLKNAMAAASHSNPRWLNKVYTNSEQIYIRQANNPALACWTLWSLKESIYKMNIKKGAARTFAPKKLLPESLLINLPAMWNDVSWKHQKVSLAFQVKITKRYVLSLVSEPKNSFVAEILDNQSNSRKAQSAVVRQKIKKQIHLFYGWELEDIDFFKDQNNIPWCINRSTNQVLNISFSHDGPLISYAFPANWPIDL